MLCKSLKFMYCMLIAMATANFATAQTQLIKSLKIDNGGSATVVPLWLKTPFSGNAATDSVLTWNPTDFSVRKIPVAALSPQLATKALTVGGTPSTSSTAAPLVIGSGTGQIVGASDATFTINNGAPLWNANQLQGAGVTGGTALDNGKVLTYNSTSNSWAPASTAATANNATLTESINGTANTFTADASADKTWTSFYAPTAAGTSGQMLVSAGTNNAPTWTAAPTVNNFTLTESINGTANTFTANASADKTWTGIYAPTTSGTTGQILQATTNAAPTWTTPTYLTSEVDGVIGNEVTNAADGTLTRTGSGTAASPYLLARPAITGDATIAAGSNASSVVALRGTAIANATPTAGQVLTYNTTTGWTPTAGVDLTPYWSRNGNSYTPATPTPMLGLLKASTAKNLNIQADSVTIVSSTDSVAGFTKLNVKGPVTNTDAFSTTGYTINFSQSNLAYTTASAGTFTLIGMKSGGTYTLAVQGTGSGTSGFTQSGLTFRAANGNGATLVGTQTIYTFIVMGTTVYFWMTTGI